MAESQGNCSKCGASLLEGARFCPECGKSVSESGPGMSFGPQFPLLGLGVAAVILAGAGIYVAQTGDHGADRDGDGVITLEEAALEIEELLEPERGVWEIELSANVIDADSGFAVGVDQEVKEFEGEFDSCQAWSELEDMLREIKEPSNYRDFVRDEEGEFRIERFSIDGERIDLAVFASSERGAPGEVNFALNGTISPEQVSVTLPFKYTEFDDNRSVDVEDSFEIEFTLDAQRTGDCN